MGTSMCAYPSLFHMYHLYSALLKNWGKMELFATRPIFSLHSQEEFLPSLLGNNWVQEMQEGCGCSPLFYSHISRCFASFLDIKCLLYLCHITGSIVAALSGDLLTFQPLHKAEMFLLPDQAPLQESSGRLRILWLKGWLAFLKHKLNQGWMI